MPLRILVIEDNADSRDLISYLLRAFGHIPLLACDGMEGLEIAAREQPDLVICDIDLPRMNGCEVARSLQADERLRPIPRVAVTALAMVGDRDRILAAGFDGYIAKPLEAETFVAEVEKYVAGHRPPANYAGPRQEQGRVAGHSLWLSTSNTNRIEEEKHEIENSDRR